MVVDGWCWDISISGSFHKVSRGSIFEWSSSSLSVSDRLMPWDVQWLIVRVAWVRPVFPHAVRSIEREVLNITLLWTGIWIIPRQVINKRVQGWVAHVQWFTSKERNSSMCLNSESMQCDVCVVMIVCDRWTDITAVIQIQSLNSPNVYIYDGRYWLGLLTIPFLSWFQLG